MVQTEGVPERTVTSAQIPQTPETQQNRLEKIKSDITDMQWEKFLSFGDYKKAYVTLMKQDVEGFKKEVEAIKQQAKSPEVQEKAEVMLGKMDKILNPPEKGLSILDRLSGWISNHSFPSLAGTFKPLTDLFAKKPEFVFHDLGNAENIRVVEDDDEFDYLSGEVDMLADKTSVQDEDSDSFTIVDDSSSETEASSSSNTKDASKKEENKDLGFDPTESSEESSTDVSDRSPRKPEK